MNEGSKPVIDYADLADAWVKRVDDIGPILEAEAAEGEKIRELTGKAMAALHGKRLFRMLLAKKAGGEELPLPVFCRVIEAIAKYDGSAAWCVGQGSGCSMLGGYLDTSISSKIWGDNANGVLAWGPGKAEAKAVDGGYLVTAKTMFVSGSHHATWLATHCSTVYEQDGSVRMGKGDKPEIRTTFIPANETTLSDKWYVFGLRNTGSDGFELKEHFVPEEHTIVRATMIEGADELSPLYNFSTMAIYAMGFSSVALGLSAAVLDKFLEIAQDKKPRNAADVLRDNPVVQDEVARMRAKLRGARRYLFAEVEDAWQETLINGAPTLEQRLEIRLAATHAIHEAKTVVDTLFDTGGTSSIFADGPFERRLRDIHAVALQIQGRKTHFRTVGEWLMGHPPNMSVI
jgi:alkylation response protein AidB-like acyl-CoA dehydrogenase